MKKILLICTIILGLSYQAKSSHAVGGDIQFVQTGSNSYNISMRLFRYCSGINYGNNYSLTILDQVTCATVQTVSLNRVSQFDIPFGDECYTPPLCVQQHEYAGTIASLPNNPNGYMVTWTENARNTVLNMNGGSLSLYTKIPDPALTAGNSTPRFVDYPSDGYFCINELKCIDFSATDSIDGDSLSYELVNPINYFSGGCTPVYLTFKPTFNMTNILGPGSSCTIDSRTGCVWARPSMLGIYIISVKCTEWRNGVKIGEVVRDIQYSALNCNYNKLPDYYDFEEIQTLKFDENGCFDVAAFDNDPEDTFFIDVLSDAYVFGAIATLPQPNTSGLYNFNWKNSTNGLTDSITNVNVKKLTSTKFEGVGRIGVRFCWTPDDCKILSIDTFNLNLFGYSLGCDGSVDSIEKKVKIVVERPIPNYLVPNVFSPNNDGIHDEYKLEQGAFDRCYDALTIKIYNRWGQKVFESDDTQFKWNGKDENGNELVEGTYFVVLQGFYGGKEVTQNFPVTLFR